MGNVNELQDSAFDTKVLKSSKPVLVDFWATWCQPCKSLAPIVDEVAGEFSSKVDFYKLDTDSNKQFAAQFGVRGLPTLMLFNNGQIVGQLIGMTSKVKIQEMLKKVTGA